MPWPTTLTQSNSIPCLPTAVSVPRRIKQARQLGGEGRARRGQARRQAPGAGEGLRERERGSQERGGGERGSGPGESVGDPRVPPPCALHNGRTPNSRAYRWSIMHHLIRTLTCPTAAAASLCNPHCATRWHCGNLPHWPSSHPRQRLLPSIRNQLSLCPCVKFPYMCLSQVPLRLWECAFALRPIHAP